MTSQTGEQLIKTLIMLNITRKQGNQAMKFGQLITWETFFLKNLTQNVVENLDPDPFLIVCKLFKSDL